MKRFAKRSTALLTVAMIFVAMCFTNASAATTGYTKASDVNYSAITYSGKIANWGSRGEACIFLTSKAMAFYTGEDTFDELSDLKGGTSQSNATSSTLYAALRNLMVENHKTITSYGDCRYLYQYTDCQNGDTSKISLWYSGNVVSSTWDKGETYNREHVWPKSKTLWKESGVKIDNYEVGEVADIMSIRPAVKSTNTSRGDKAYGESTTTAYYSLSNSDIRGDAARILLYNYVRWDSNKYMWGSNGVIQSLEIMLKWMQEDPVDTWEMGRNDSVQSITGTRNVFVDYPEFAWLLFGKDVPTSLKTPSGEAKKGITAGTVVDNTASTNNNSSVNSGVNNNSGNGNNTSTNQSVADREDEDDVSSVESNVGGIENKPQNEGQPYDPSLLGGTPAENDTEGFELEAWMIIVPVAVLGLAVIAAVVIVIIVKKKKK